MDKPAVRRVASDEHEAAAGVLASAFSTDPIFDWMLPGDSNERRGGHFFKHLLGAALRSPDHLVDTVESGHAVAYWRDMDGAKPTAKEVASFVVPAVRTFGRNLPRALKVQAATEAAHPKVPHRYLAFIGVREGQQGKGYGSALLAQMTEQLDEQGLASYLESSNPLNNPLYARYGFVETGEVDLPDGAPVMTTMWRDPR